ncbi:hypothetical protein [Streptomyces roseoverticillatus]|uniref:Uncharacterized protein n=1 Tax=Streptomyces roseoverticillatus TaxID=66429 RepID=A0ABV3J3H4_9ACTN
MNAALSRAGRAALALGAALALATGLSTSAHGAAGSFTYRSTGGTVGNFVDPSNNTCFFFEFPASRAENNTNTRAKVYNSAFCGGGVVRDVPAHGTVDVGGDSLNSVQFVP